MPVFPHVWSSVRFHVDLCISLKIPFVHISQLVNFTLHLAKFLAYFGQFLMLLGKFSLLQMSK